MMEYDDIVVCKNAIKGSQYRCQYDGDSLSDCSFAITKKYGHLSGTRYVARRAYGRYTIICPRSNWHANDRFYSSPGPYELVKWDDIKGDV